MRTLAGWVRVKFLVNANNSYYDDSVQRNRKQPLSERTPVPPFPARNSEDDRPAAPRRIDSRTLFGESAVVLIDHEGETYALRRTRLGKLILTK